MNQKSNEVDIPEFHKYLPTRLSKTDLFVCEIFSVFSRTYQWEKLLPLMRGNKSPSRSILTNIHLSFVPKVPTSSKMYPDIVKLTKMIQVVGQEMMTKFLNVIFLFRTVYYSVIWFYYDHFLKNTVRSVILIFFLASAHYLITVIIGPFEIYCFTCLTKQSIFQDWGCAGTRNFERKSGNKISVLVSTFQEFQYRFSESSSKLGKSWESGFPKNRKASKVGNSETLRSLAWPLGNTGLFRISRSCRNSWRLRSRHENFSSFGKFAFPVLVPYGQETIFPEHP